MSRRRRRQAAWVSPAPMMINGMNPSVKNRYQVFATADTVVKAWVVGRRFWMPVSFPPETNASTAFRKNGRWPSWVISDCLNISLQPVRINCPGFGISAEGGPGGAGFSAATGFNGLAVIGSTGAALGQAGTSQLRALEVNSVSRVRP